MKQIIQSFKTGDTLLEEVPAPVVSKGHILIKSTYSLVSLGTERMLVEFGKSNLISKARQQPDKVKEVLNKIKTEGLLPTLEAVFNKLGEPLPLGYCNVGKVIAIGEGVQGFSVGDRVASNGQHAEVVSVPMNLVAKVPENVSDIEATFTVIGSIGLQGIRLVNPTFGETVVVFGLGLIGLITSQLLKANGCKVIGVDFDQSKLDLAKKWNIITCNPKQEDVVKFVQGHTGGIGTDAVVITASAKTDEIISHAANMSRKRGRIVLVGVIGLNISRAEFYEKELTFQVSCSYGPGRYDHNYEQKGIDYPLPFVRWTEKRNFETILHSISSRQLHVKDLVTEVVPLEEYQKIYEKIGQAGSIASILEYPERTENLKNTIVLSEKRFTGQKGIVGVIGSGNFTKMTMLPLMKESGAHFKYIASKGGVTSTSLAKKFGFTHSTTDYQEILNDTDVDLVMITTRHNLHASMVLEVLKQNKHVFVEKPLALNKEELIELIEVANLSSGSVTVGFNRRFSPHSLKIKQNIGTGPMNIIATMNAGFIPADVWVQDLKVGGGRIVGEACHLIDLCSFFTGSKVISVCMNAMGVNPAENTDNASILLKFEDGSNAVINYFANGSKTYSKERVEIYSQGRTVILDNFRRTTAYGFRNFSGLKTSLDKGHKNQFHSVVKKVQQGGEPLISFESLINTSLASFGAIESLKERNWIDLSI
uniref:bi-domain-containing oxidoreductase n=1 Tax=Algoriphagus sp. TaxID=1872435 RepID=UPI00404764F0